MSYTVNVYGDSGLLWTRTREWDEGVEFQPKRGKVGVSRVTVLVDDDPPPGESAGMPGAVAPGPKLPASPLVDLSDLMGYRLRVPRGGVEAVGLFKGAAFVQVGGHQWYSDDWSDLDATATATAIEARLWPEVTP